jgi:hypothetical protein
VLPKAGTSVAGGLAFIGNLVTGQGYAAAVESAANNSFNQFFNSLDEGLREAMPIYKSQAYAEGNFLSDFFTTSFWSDDLFDGLAYAASSYLPGKAIGMIPNVLSKVNKWGLAGAKIGAALTKAGNVAGITQQQALTTIVNTLGEAGVESHETQKSVEMAMLQKLGFPTLADAPPEVREKIKQTAAEAAQRTFAWNAAALLLPNLLQSKLFFPKSATKASDDMIRAIRYDGKSAADLLKNKSEYMKKFALNAASEGLWEENIQTSVSQYERRRATTPPDYDAFTGPLVNMANNAWGFAKTVGSFNMAGVEVGSDQDEGGAAIGLGMAIGGGMSLVSTYTERQQTEKLADQQTKL